MKRFLSGYTTKTVNTIFLHVQCIWKYNVHSGFDTRTHTKKLYIFIVYNAQHTNLTIENPRILK